MKKIASISFIAVAALAAASLPAQADSYMFLSKAAAEIGYTYDTHSSDGSVELQRPGVAIIVRPGQTVYEVNYAREVMDEAPIFVKRDLLVSDEFVNRLRRIAQHFPLASRSTSGVTGTPIVEASGAIVLAPLRQKTGSDMLIVSGTAPANVPITIALNETFSHGVPDVLLTRKEIVADASGRFETEVSTAPGYFRGGRVTVVATSVHGVTQGSSDIVLDPPNDKVSVPADIVPRSIR